MSHFSLAVGLFMLILVSVCVASCFIYPCLSRNLCNFWSLFLLHVTSLPLSLSFLFQVSRNVCVDLCCPNISLLGSVHFSSFFFSFLLLRLNNHKWPVFRFLSSSFCLFMSATETLKWIFQSSYIFSAPEFLFDSFFIICSSLLIFSLFIYFLDSL